MCYTCSKPALCSYYGEYGFVKYQQTLLFLQWEIYDFYVEELKRREKSKEKQEGQVLNKEEDKNKKKMIQAETQVARHRL